MKIPKKYIKILLFIFGLLLCISLVFYIFTKYNCESFDNKIPEFGIVITRHVNNENADRIWKKCLEQVRKYYPTEPVVIIDDNSDYQYIKPDGIDFTNCTIIDSEIKKAGEMLPYYYFYKYHWFDKMLFIHDSVFIEKRIEYRDISTVKAVWHFDPLGSSNEESEYSAITELIPHLNHNEELTRLYDNSAEWKGDYGVMSLITYSYVKHIMEKYNIINMVQKVDSRVKRMACERIMGLIFSHDDPNFVKNPSIIGNYLNTFNNQLNYSYGYEHYMEDVNKNMMKAPINKLFFGR